MFAKLSAVALCASLVSALQLNAPTVASPGQSLVIQAAKAPEEPARVEIVLLDLNVEVEVQAFGIVLIEADISVNIDIFINPGEYQFAAIDPATKEILSKSNPFMVRK